MNASKSTLAVSLDKLSAAVQAHGEPIEERTKMAAQSTPGILRVGDEVIWRGGWGANAPARAKVLNIEVLPAGNPDDGIPVDSILWLEVYGRSVVVDLDNGKWAYGAQIKPVTE